MRGVIRLFFRAIRMILSPLVRVGARLAEPQGVERTAEAQAEMDRRTSRLALYQFETCPFCVKVRRQIARQSLRIELRDAQREPLHRQALVQGGGSPMVPCLRIEQPDGAVRWLYESRDIIRYLEHTFG